MSAAFECSVCTESFDAADHKPLCLPCGHTFCLACVLSLEKSQSKSCHTCRTPMTQKADQLPVVYALIGLEKTAAAMRCKTHTHELEYWCVPCEESLCKKCVKAEHGEHCVEFMEDLVDNKGCTGNGNAGIVDHLSNKRDRLKSGISLRAEIAETFDAVQNEVAKISTQKDLLVASEKSVNKDLAVWSDKKKAPSTAEGKRQLFRDIVHRSKKLKVPEDEELFKLEYKLSLLKKTVDFLQAPDGPDDVLGERLSSMGDVDECAALEKIPSVVCCLPSLPVTAGIQMAQLEWRPRCWHFPDLRDDGVSWLRSLVSPIPNVNRRHLHLPECHLSEKGFRRLLAFTEFNVIYCEPLQLSVEAQRRLSKLCQLKCSYIVLEWAVPLVKCP